jgi:hypothetical protein
MDPEIVLVKSGIVPVGFEMGFDEVRKCFGLMEK